jgi:hypothetical protein
MLPALKIDARIDPHTSDAADSLKKQTDQCDVCKTSKDVEDHIGIPIKPAIKDRA